MTKDAMLRSLFGWGIALFFLWFVFLSVVGDTWFYLETEVRIAVSLFMTGIAVLFRYLCLRIRKLEAQMEDLMRRRGQEANS